MTVRLAVGPGTVTRALSAARTFAGTAGLGADASDRLAVIVEEWVANIVEHGRPAPHSLVTLRLEIAGQGVRLTFSDAGVAFDPREAADTGPNLERGGGAGLALVAAWTEVEDYRRARGRNRLTLRSKS